MQLVLLRETEFSLYKVIYIRLAITIHLDGNVSSFALVSKKK